MEYSINNARIFVQMGTESNANSILLVIYLDICLQYLPLYITVKPCFEGLLTNGI